MRGCIPVIMMDGVKSEFEEQLPLKEYALRIPMYMAFRTPAILKHLIESGRAAQMQVVVWLGCGHTLLHDAVVMPNQSPSRCQRSCSTALILISGMQENLKCAWRLHWWRRPHGKAFEVVM